MTHETIKIFLDEIYSKGPKQNYITNKTDVSHFEDICSSDIIDLKEYGPENIIRYIYVLVLFDNFSKYGWTVLLGNKSAQKITNSSEIFYFKKKLKCNWNRKWKRVAKQNLQ